MSFIFTLESFKFFKLKDQTVLRALFLTAFLLNVAVLVFPLGNGNILPILERVQAGLLSQDPNEVLAGFSLFTREHYLFYGVQLLLIMFNFFMSYLYANAYLAERRNEAASRGLLSLLKSLPKLVLIGLILFLPILFSSLLFFIPLIIIAVTYVFAPVFASMEKHGALESLEDSRKLSRGNRLAIGITFAVQVILFNFPVNLILGFLPKDTNVILVVQAFANSFFLLMRGRLIGIFYYFFRVQLMNKKLEDLIGVNPQDLFKPSEPQKPDDQ